MSKKNKKETKEIIIGSLVGVLMGLLIMWWMLAPAIQIVP